MLDALLQTLATRPYVFVFLAAFLVISTLNRGIARTLILLIAGYWIAFVSEYCSIHWGFPYGDYFYIEESFAGELALAGVPFWDSISYSFIAYASLETASYLKWRPRILAAALLMVGADVVIDPVAVRGAEWFLGQVFFYPEGGIYFGVPLSNFVGWFVVGFLILTASQALSTRLALKDPSVRFPQLGPYFYYSILIFMWTVSIAIGEFLLTLVGLLLHSPIFYLLYRRKKET